MCGIAGIIHLDGMNAAKWLPTLECMLYLMKHRGPDDRGSKVLGPLVCGHLRLSILDLSKNGHQPMAINDGKIWITYNGEIYNFIELRKELEALGSTFRSNTDTEVILHAYRHWGLDCFTRFNGMWALAIWDSQIHQLVLSRDRVGIKPLYWCIHQGNLVFASEIKAIVAYKYLNNFKIELSPDSINTYIKAGLVDGLEETFFKGIYRFKSGHVMILRDGDIKIYQSYWDLPKAAQSISRQNANSDENELIVQLENLLNDATKKHMRSDVPVGVCLSGGLDSSCVAAMASKNLNQLNTFTTWFPEGEEWNELPHADIINSRFNLMANRKKVDGDQLLNKLEKILWYLDEPTLAMGIYPHWNVMETASRKVKVVLDGQGGDEIFAGYDPYVAWFLYSRLLNKDLKSYRNTLSGYYKNYGLDRVNHLGQEVKSLYLANAATNMPDKFSDPFDNFLYLELTRNKLPALLRYEDRLSMAFSIESRVPLLDFRIIEFAFSLKSKNKIGAGWSKYLFRKTLADILPDEITWRKDKKGFPTPFEIWADGSLRNQLRDTVLSSGSKVVQLFGKDGILNFFRVWDSGKKDAWFLWRLLSLEVWLQTYLENIRTEVEVSKSIKKKNIIHCNHLSSIEKKALVVNKSKPKICHIGGAHSVHISDIVCELDKRGYRQCVISYFPGDQSITPPHIPVYSFPYRNYDQANWKTQNFELLLHQLLEQVVEREKPDLVHGHSLTYSCVPLWLLKEHFELKTLVMPWSVNSMVNSNPIANYYEKKCLSTLDKFLYPLPEGFKQFQNFYGELNRSQFVHFKALVDLSLYDQQREIHSQPRILSARVMGKSYCQDLLVKALPRFVAAFPNTRVTLIIGQHTAQGQAYFDLIRNLAEKLEVGAYCSFIDHSLSQSEFADLIKTHNIIYSVSNHDVGFSSTNIQSAYSGAITIMQKSKWVRGILDDQQNVLQSSIDEQSISNALIFAGSHLIELQNRFLEKNKKLKQYSKEVMMESLIRCYQELFDITKKGT